MGSFSYTCHLSGVPITSGEKACIIPLQHRGNLYEYSDKDLAVFGQSSLVSNDGEKAKFKPVMFPIHGIYNDYGTLENIVKDDNTEALEKFYDLTIEQIVAILTSGRKDDGYDDDLKIIMDPSVKYEYGKPVYLERYKELLSYSCTWIHGDIYDAVTIYTPGKYDSHNSSMGDPVLLKYFGFIELEEKGSDPRFNRLFEIEGSKGKVVLESDGRWLNKSIYYFSDLKRILEEKGVSIDISKIGSMNYSERMLRIIAPEYEVLVNRPDGLLERLTKAKTEGKDVEDLLKAYGGSLFDRMDENQKQISRILLNTADWSSERVQNPHTIFYWEAVKEGKLIDIAAKFNRFFVSMFATGRYYDLIGTSPQCGEPKEVKRVLEAALSVVNAQIKERELYEDEEDEEEEE